MGKETAPNLELGVHIRDHVIPSGMSVTEAAGRLGVTRANLSNLLNGKASLSPEMAFKLQTAFGADAQDLLARQTAAARQTVSATAYVPHFLTIKARQISDWVDGNLEARQLFPVFLRKLIHSTGNDLRLADFPGHDDAERKGWDGTTEAGVATPWIPEGRTCWELGTDKTPHSKAETDYKARLSSVTAVERADCTFVFVTARHWPGKTQWAKEKNAARDWKSIRAYDASDLEQWLEGSISAQIWLAEKLALPLGGFETPERFWQRWSNASEPAMAAEIFVPSITAYRDAFSNWLQQDAVRPFTVAADSKEEALAFVACLLRDESIAARARDVAAIFESAETLRKLAASSARFIPIVYTEEAERELADVYRRLHCIVIRTRNAVSGEPDITLDLLRHEDFQKALGAMNLAGEEIERLAAESGYSPTILRRRLSKIEAVKRPRWAQDHNTARSLIPMTLIGAWHSTSEADREILSTLSAAKYEQVEEAVLRLRQFDDCPVWAESDYRGVASKIDALFGVKDAVTKADLETFFFISEYALSETDPALSLPEDQRPFASIYGKVRGHSTVLREGICETLVLLAVHANNLFGDRLGNVEGRVSMLIRGLLTPLTLEKLLSQDQGLPRYAEAAPEEFLSLIEADLKTPEPVVLGLLKPATSFFSGPSRSGLLWALECLAWKPGRLLPVSLILARLSRTEIEDNWTNKPISSLVALYLSWMPQTAATIDDRVRALEEVNRRFPDIGWQICIHQFEAGQQMGHHSNRPRWRSDASGAGQVVSQREAWEFSRKALDLTLAWEKHDARTLGDLIERFGAMDKEDQAVVWSLVDKWAAAEPNEAESAILRERIRLFALTRRGSFRGVDDATRDRARETYDKLAPSDPAVRHGWLFAKQWVEESLDEIDDESTDYNKRTERVERLRAEALKDVWAQRGFDGVEALLIGGEASNSVGHHASLCVLTSGDPVDFLRRCLNISGDLTLKADGCVHGFLQAIEDPDRRNSIIAATAAGLDADQTARLFRCAPFGQNTWRLLDSYGLEVRRNYWREVFPYSSRWLSDAEVTEFIDRLLEANRPRAAFNAIHYEWEKVETSRLKRLLLAVATTSIEVDSGRIDSYHVGEALKAFDARGGVTRDEKAQLEFLFIEALDQHREGHGIPNLEKQIAETPNLYAQAVAHSFKRRGGGEDPPEWRIDDPQKRTAVATATHRLLHRIKRIPGTGEDGKIDPEALIKWIEEVRRLCSEYGRVETGDQCIGQLLAHAPPEENGGWPCKPVCDALETLGSEHIGIGFQIGVHNSRGAVWRGEGGAQERELAAKYRAWAKALAFEYPYVSRVVEGIAGSYDRDAAWHDSNANVRKRLRH